jgi:hypothetical protein
MQKWENLQLLREFHADQFFDFNDGSPYAWCDLEEASPDYRMPEVDRLNRLGEEGWELVTVLHEENVYEHDTYVYYLKRAAS